MSTCRYRRLEPSRRCTRGEAKAITREQVGKRKLRIKNEE